VFPSNVERWRGLVELERGSVPTDLVLAVMRRESFGKVGGVGGKDDRYGYTDAEIACGFPSKWRKRDLGLMQVAPLTLRSYNETNRTAITPCDLIGTTEAAARLQIRVGAWALSRALVQAPALSPALARSSWPFYASTPPDEQVLLARAIYGFGYKGTTDRLEAAAAAGYPRTFGGLEAHNPTPARLFEGARTILSWYRSGGGDNIETPAPSKPTRPGSGSGAPAPALLALLLLWLYSSSRKGKTT